MNYYDIFSCDTNNGNFHRVSIFLSGCLKQPKCCGCFSPHTWDTNCGKPYTQETEDYIIKCLSKSYIKGLSILGGNPTDLLSDGWLIKLVKRVNEELPQKTIYCWSGDNFEDLIKRKECVEFFQYIDMLRDGAFIPELKDLNQYLQGSKNQRYVNVKESLKNNKFIEYKFS